MQSTETKTLTTQEMAENLLPMFKGLGEQINLLKEESLVSKLQSLKEEITNLADKTFLLRAMLTSESREISTDLLHLENVLTSARDWIDFALRDEAKARAQEHT